MVQAGARATLVAAKGSPASAYKQWIAGTLQPAGSVTVDAGAAQALAGGKSLLPAGIKVVEGQFERGVCLSVRGPDGARALLPPGRGRGSSVSSVVCYLTGLSHVDPVEAGLFLGRFLNEEITEAPDIDLDFPRDIREKLIVAVTERYGREHAALVASFATYRSRGAIRDVGKALGLPYAELERLSRLSDGWDARRVGDRSG